MWAGLAITLGAFSYIFTLGACGRMRLVASAIVLCMSQTSHFNDVSGRHYRWCGDSLFARTKTDKFSAPGPHLDASGHPRLFVELASIADALREPLPRKVYLISGGERLGRGTRPNNGFRLPPGDGFGAAANAHLDRFLVTRGPGA